MERALVHKKSITYILWTGGWDSTFRIVELSRMDIIIQPVYIIDSNRVSRDYELLAMKKIISTLNRKSQTKAQILQVKTYKLDEIPRDEEISKAYRIIYKETKLGSQHEWLAWLGKLYPGMEMGTEAGSPETSHIIHALQKFCKLDFEGDIGIVNKKESSLEGNLVLGWFKFPIIRKTEVEMRQLIELWGYQDVMKQIWFCHNPINAKPCGFCHPCEVKMESEMQWLLTESGRENYKMRKFIKKYFGSRVANIYARIYRCINK